MAVKKRMAAKSGKKKKWFKIVAPATFNKADIGEILLFEPEQAVGRTVKVNLMTLTHDPKKQDKLVAFSINERKESFLHTIFRSYEMVPSSIKRLSKRERSKVEDSFRCLTKDKRDILIKPVIVTKNKVNKATKSDLRRECRLLIKEMVSELVHEKFLNLLVTDRFQKQLFEELKKIVPLSAFRIKRMALMPEKKE